MEAMFAAMWQRVYHSCSLANMSAVCTMAGRHADGRRSRRAEHRRFLVGISATDYQLRTFRCINTRFMTSASHGDCFSEAL